MTTHAEPAVAAPARRVPARAQHAPVRTFGPWTLRECRALAVIHVVALAVIVGSYWKSSGQAHPADQLTWLNLSVVAMLVAGGADALFFARGHRAAARVRRALFVPAPTVGPAPAPDRWVAIRGGRRFHRSDCAFVAGKPAADDTRTAHEAAGRVACEVCRPGEPGEVA